MDVPKQKWAQVRTKFMKVLLRSMKTFLEAIRRRNMAVGMAWGYRGPKNGLWLGASLRGKQEIDS